MLKQMKTSSLLLYMIIVSMAIAPAFALGDGNRNLFLIGVMTLSPVVLFKYHNFYKSEIWLLLFMLSIIFIPALHHPESMRWSTVMYSLMYGFTFLAYSHLLRLRRFTIENYLTLLKCLIYAYTIVLVIQQICVFTGLPIFNLSNYDPNEPFKLNSLSAEPSHSARIVALLMYCFIIIKEAVVNRKYNFSLDLKEDKLVWVGFLWTMLTMGSGTAFLFIGIVLLKFMRFKNIMALSILAGSIVYGANAIGVHAFDRTFDVIKASLTLDINTIINTDLSAAIRIAPMIVLSTMVNFVTVDGLFGHGIDYVGTFMSDYIPAVPEHFSAGGMLVLWMEYGFIPFILFVTFSLNAIYQKGQYLNLIFWFMLVFMYGVNGQIVWLTIILLYTSNYFYNKRTGVNI